MEQVTHLTEWPTVLLAISSPNTWPCRKKFWSPSCATTRSTSRSKIKHHALAPHFLTVLNTEVDAEGMAIIRHGNERVLRARFNDARFFWNYDQKIPLEQAA